MMATMNKATAVGWAFALITLFFGLTGCNLPQKAQSEAESTRHDIDQGITRGRAALNEDPDYVVELPTSYLGSRSPIRIQPLHKEIPPQLHTRVDLNFADSITAETLAQILAAETSLRVVVSSDLRSKPLQDLNWSGAAVDLLDRLSGQYGIYWRWKNSKIELFRKELRYWTIYFPGVKSKWVATIGLSGTVSGRGGSDLSAEDHVTVSMDDSTLWAEIEATVRELLSPDGAVSISPQSGELAIIDTPESLDRIDEWVRNKNRHLTSQVLLAVELYEIEQSDKGESGFSVEGFVQLARKSGLVTLTSVNNADESLVSLKLEESDLPDFHNVAAIIRQSAGESRVSKLTSSVVRGLNGQPMPVFFGDETSYLQKREVVENENGTSVRLIPGTLQDGIALNVVPRILPDTNQMILHATIRTTYIKSISRFPANAGPNDPVIQLPDLETRSMLLPVLLRSGETLVVAGLDTRRTAQGGNKGLLSIGKSAEASRTSLILLITPRIIEPDLEIVQLLSAKQV